MSTPIVHYGQQTADGQVTADLINAFLTEQLYELNEDTIKPLNTESELIQQLYKSYDGVTQVHVGELMFLVETSIRLGLQWVQDSPIYFRNSEGNWSSINSPNELAEVVLRLSLSDEVYSLPGVADFLESIQLTKGQLELSLSSEQIDKLIAFAPTSPFEWFIKGERIAALRDRPFHPTAKAKVGFTEQDYQQYSAEFGELVHLRWVMVRIDSVEQGCIEGRMSCLDILNTGQRALVEAEMDRRGVRDEYIPIPVHPWQLEHIILQNFVQEIEEGIIIVLDVEAGAFLATSSLRSMTPESGSTVMLKLPVSVLSLGAARYLPVVKLLNGLAGEKMLRQAIACDETLKDKVYLCEEQNWWGYMPTTMGLFDDHPRHLSAQLRVYPPELLNEDYKVIPMSAFGVNLAGRHYLSEIMGKTLSCEEVLSFYTSLATMYYDVVMRLFKVGVVPEIHGQNCCLVMKQNQVKGLLFRDHDSVRLHQPYLDKHGIGDPGYHIRPGYSNSLYNETIQKLIFYVQSLGTQVNLASIMEALSEVYGIPQVQLWAITEEAWKAALQAVELPEEDRAELYRAIFESQEWPVKLIVRPLLESDGVPGAMPSGKGKGHNPFYVPKL